MHQPLHAWHYTHARNLRGIMNDGALRGHPNRFPSVFEQDTTRPHLWFSLNQFWEPSISPPLRPELRELRLREDGPDWDEYIWRAMIESGGSWVRFGIPANPLRSPFLTRPAITNPLFPPSPSGLSFSASLNDEENRQTIENWRVSFKEVPIEICTIESMDADLEWRRIHTPKQKLWLH